MNLKKLFTPNWENSDLAVEEPIPEIKPEPQYSVQEIHEAFDNAQEELLKEAQKILNLTPPEVDLSKADRLIKLGFGNTKTVTESQEQRKIKNDFD